MSVGPTGPAFDAAGVPLAQTKGAALDRAQQRHAANARQADALARSQAATRPGAPTGDMNVTDESAADGRRPWERREETECEGAAPEAAAATPSFSPLREEEGEEDKAAAADTSAIPAAADRSLGGGLDLTA